MALEITDENVQNYLSGEQPVVIDFWAPWCGPCRAIAPLIDELSATYEGKVVIGKYNVDEGSDFVAEHGIRTIPTLLFFKNGILKEKLVGAVQKTAIQEKIDSLL